MKVLMGTKNPGKIEGARQAFEKYFDNVEIEGISVNSTEGKLICKVLDEDIGEVSTKMDEPRLRRGARGIVVREDGKIAVFNKSNENEYKLPGGGLEGEEEPEEAFKREVI